MQLLFVWFLTLAKNHLQPVDLMEEEGCVCVLELLPSSAQSFRLLLLFFKFWFNIQNSGSCPHIIKALSQLCVWLQKWRTPQRLLYVAVQHFVAWLWALKLNRFKTRWKCCSALPLHFRSNLLCCSFSSGNACKCCPQSRHPLCRMVHVITCCLHGKRFQQLYGQWHYILQHIQCLPLNVYQLRTFVPVFFPPCCSMYTAHPGVRRVPSWTTSLVLVRVS